jgi:hypothetical protein
MILWVETTGQDGEPLRLVEGAVVPEWGGGQAGLPGKAYAKLLRDVVSGEMPVVSYWKQTQIVSDNRLAAFETDVSTYTFALPSSLNGEIAVSATVMLRRVFQDVAEARGWDMPNMLMAEAAVAVTVEAE